MAPNLVIAMLDQLTDFRDDFVHHLVRLATLYVALEPMPESCNRMVLRAIRREVFEFQP